tara:strand:+ start:570 stop:1205 length:636 start_codon:yes stop_codon:yes gene_type:complete
MKIELIDVLPEPIPANAGKESEVWMSNWVLDAGKRHLVSGVSGRGKSTLLQILCGIRTDFSGKLILDGKDSQKISPEEWTVIRSQKVSLLFQDLRLFPELTALENIHLIPAGSKNSKDIEKMSKRLGIHQLLDKRCSLLSQGQRQRVALMRALSRPFEILLLDEPFSHLDEGNALLAWNIVGEELELQNAGLILTALNESSHLEANEIWKL